VVVPSYKGSVKRRTTVQAGPGINETSYLKNKLSKKGLSDRVLA
jgi:hypothetical protein